jgi:hypothetical protein
MEVPCGFTKVIPEGHVVHMSYWLFRKLPVEHLLAEADDIVEDGDADEDGVGVSDPLLHAMYSSFAEVKRPPESSRCHAHIPAAL